MITREGLCLEDKNTDDEQAREGGKNSNLKHPVYLLRNFSQSWTHVDSCFGHVYYLFSSKGRESRRET